MKKVLLLVLLFTAPCFGTYFIEGKNHGDKLVADEPNKFAFGTDDFTLCIWIRNTTTNGWVVRWYNGMIGAGIYLRLDSPYEDNRPWFGITDNSLYGWYSVKSSVSILDGQWHLIAVTCDRSESEGLSIFIDGIDRSTERYQDLTELAGYNYAFNPPWSSVNFDYFYHEESFDYLQIDQFRLYKGKILTQPEIAAIYNNRVGTPVIESAMESLSGFCYFEFEQGSGNPIGRQWNGSSWSNITTVNYGLLWGFGGVDPWNQYERNGDCFINFIDFSIFAQDWLKTEPNLISDFDFSGTVDLNDLGMFVDYWLTGNQGAAPVVQNASFTVLKNANHTFDINATDLEQLTYSIESLPTYGTVWDANGSQITTVPRVLSSKTVQYRAGDYNNVNDSFIFAADDKTGYDPPCGGKVTGTATIFVQGITLPGKATNPVPEMNAVNVAIDVNLSWTVGQDANSHFVYLGTVLPPAFQGQQSGNLFDPNFLLAYDTNYFWEVNESGPNGVTTGDIWKFTTKVSPTIPVAANINVSVYNYVTNTITLSATDDGEPNPPGQLEYYIVSLPENGILQDPCSENIIEGFMLPYSLSFYGNQVWYKTEANSVQSFTYKANDGNQYSNIATVTITMLNHPKDLLSFNEFGIVEFNDTNNFYDANNGWAIDFWIRTQEPFAGLMKKRDANQGWEIGIVSGAPKIYIYDVNATVVATIQSFWRIDDGYWHEVAFNFLQDGNSILLTVQLFYWGTEQSSFSGNFGSIENDCNLLITGYRGDIDMLRFFAGIYDAGDSSSIIQGFLNRDGTGFESWMGFGAESKVRFPMNEGIGTITIDDKRGMVGTLKNADVRWYPFWYPFFDGD